MSDDPKKAAEMKMEHMQREYWRVRNGKQRFIRCPYCCESGDLKEMYRNFHGAPQFCCPTFARALKAILDRQDEVDKAWKAAQTVTKLGKMVESVN